MISLDRNKKYLLACSFGPDSMSLFDVLIKGNYQFSVAMVNYHLRPESNDEMNGLISHCVKFGISYYIKDLKEGITKGNVEAECRKIRYEYFAEVCNKAHFDAVLVAHNEDDLIETYLLQKKRKNLPIFYGIKERTIINGVQVIRPLLRYSKAFLMEYCDANGVPYAIDSSNLETKYLRNQIRHNVVSKLTNKERKAIVEEINKKNHELEELLYRLNSLDLNNVDILKSLNDLELAYSLNILAKRLDESLTISYKLCLEIQKVLSAYGNIDVPIRKGVVLRKSYDRINFVRPSKVFYEFVVEGPSIMETHYFFLDFTGDTSNRNVKLEDYPLTIRTYQPGDKYQIKDYLVSVRRLFIDWKMPLSLRERWPIILNKDGKIIYIPRYQKNFIKDKNTNFYVK